jgi:DNA-binding NarL/FixJ family response regulator
VKNVICLEKPGALLGRVRRLSTAENPEMGFSLTSCAANTDDILWIAQHLRPVILVIEEVDVVKLDLEKLQRALPLANLYILIVAEGPDETAVEHYLRLGCSGTILQTASDQTFLKAIHAVLDGEIWVPRKVLSRLLHSLLFGEPGRSLTKRELEVLTMICKGSTNQQIADELFISRETVRWHLRSVYSKIRAKDRDSAIRYAIDIGLTRNVV